MARTGPARRVEQLLTDALFDSWNMSCAEQRRIAVHEPKRHSVHNTRLARTASSSVAVLGLRSLSY